MKHFMLYTISILLIIISCVTSKNLTTQDRITNAIFHNDKASVAKLVEYPFPQPYPLKPILNEQEFIQYYDRIISLDLCKELQNSTVEDWHQKSWRGVYFKNGEIWIRDKSLMEEDTIDSSEGYKLYAINYPNPLQKAALDSLRKIERKIIDLDKNESNAPQACYLSKDSTFANLSHRN